MRWRGFLGSIQLISLANTCWNITLGSQNQVKIHLPRLRISSWNFYCINCILDFVVERVLFNSYKRFTNSTTLNSKKQFLELLTSIQNQEITVISLCCWPTINCCFMDMVFICSSLEQLFWKHSSFFIEVVVLLLYPTFNCLK